MLSELTIAHSPAFSLVAYALPALQHADTLSRQFTAAIARRLLRQYFISDGPQSADEQAGVEAVMLLVQHDHKYRKVFQLHPLGLMTTVFSINRRLVTI
jgi:hypothetical protein